MLYINNSRIIPRPDTGSNILKDINNCSIACLNTDITKIVCVANHTNDFTCLLVTSCKHLQRIVKNKPTILTKIVVHNVHHFVDSGRQKAQSDIRYQVFTDTGSVDIDWSWCQHTTTDNSTEKVLDIKTNTWLQTNKKCKVVLKIFLVSKYRPYIHISNSILFCIFIVTIPISWSNSLRTGIEKKTVFILMPGWDLGFT